MNFNNLYNRVVHNETKEKLKREEDVEQYDHSASVAEQEEEYDDRYDRFHDEDNLKHKLHTWDGTDVALKLPGRVGEYVVEGTITYTVEVERPDASNGYIGSRWPEVEDVEVTGIFLVGEGQRDAKDITEDVTFEEMELAEKTLIGAFEQQETD